MLTYLKNSNMDGVLKDEALTKDFLFFRPKWISSDWGLTVSGLPTSD